MVESHLSNFYSFSSSFNTIAIHIEALSKKPMSVRGKGEKDDRFDNVNDALILFNKMIDKRIDLLGVSRDVYSLNILINCFCQLGRIDFGFSVLGKMLKLGVEPDVVTFSTLINGLCNQSKIFEAVSMFDEMTERGYQPNLFVCSTILKGLCKSDNTDRSVRFLRLMEGRGF
ncbi:hypothetical protein Goklo_024538 [Gossypium klotzschianum]|uniref:Pentatricopeptide repeat-containing protein n=1 Tax=Gossypium klotzschianum TaxID=34286 RepID=A0A7J8W5K0_9ROSI|nr:hypothetical protein [Gossypium klotzschianum]